MIFTLIVFHKAVNDQYKNILNSQGIDLSKYKNWTKIQNFILENLDSSKQIKARKLLMNSMNYNRAESSHYDEKYLENFYNDKLKIFLDNQTHIYKYLPHNISKNTVLNLINTSLPKMKTELWIKGYKYKPLKKIIVDIVNNTNQTTVEEIVTALKLPLSFYFDGSEAVKQSMTSESYDIKDIPKHIFMNEQKIMGIIKDVIKPVSSSKLNIEQIATNALNAMIGVKNSLSGSIKIFAKSFVASFFTYCNWMPEHTFTMKIGFKRLISKYEKFGKELNKSDTKMVELYNKYKPLFDDLKRQLNDHTIILPEDIRNKYIKPYLKYFDADFKLVSLFIQDNYSHLYDENNFFSAFREKDQPLIKPLVFTVLTNKTEKEKQESYDTVFQAILYLNNPLTPIPEFTMEWADKIAFGTVFFKKYNPNDSLNDVLAKIGIENIDSEIIKNGISNFVQFLEEIKSLSPDIIDFIINFLNDLKKVVKNDMKFDDVLKTLPFGKTISQYANAAVEHANGKPIKEAFWDLEFNNFYIERTIEAWKEVKVMSGPNLLDAVVTVNSDGKKTIDKILKLWDIASKQRANLTAKDIESVFGNSFKQFRNAVLPLINYFLSTPSDLINYLTEINPRKFALSFNEFANDLFNGNLTWETYTDMNNKLFVYLYEPLDLKYGKGGISRLAKRILIGVFSGIAFVGIISLIVFLCIRKKNKKNKRNYPTEELMSDFTKISL
ncbi:hypothetical protein TVAG_083350 [Trichomonas vaginalis G3]|uniref:Uncharacterized protein n=1 Tax=Trichomonas vaginalis (strain ATCC PRA-98 / G3) TaxID=412133 RepID=A2DM62_TRIV3|nr:hypothetical protein TVAGG3_0983990 [Trichomonas vaginalis G3]EAY18482.1 hypothetical protein TVAG_083350 [Trichomonas vaginalis G3]KAI5489529.1 hypothetical protein TVAGG3_0983990 [Trichomonas vaginalis G3]|eukprot:XP_001579468.1 hypothetical protein [Trichomonas vaginalis G3]